ncbi:MULTISPECIES: FG-GAP repeat domain-containing protein [unclassified Streptomyces]|uniref:FG-GAP repeat domain-containing protein n=1 Tax=unclassified Streptomyces TaxID=2593676 RepID=UPI00381C6373
MTLTHFKSRRVLNGLAAAALSLAIAGTAAGSASADTAPGGADAKRAQAQRKAAAAPPAFAAPRAAAAPGEVSTPAFNMTAVDRRGSIYSYWQDGKGGLKAGIKLIDADDINYTGEVQQQAVDNNKDGKEDGNYTWWDSGQLNYSDTSHGVNVITVGFGWEIYDKVLSPGDLGGAEQADIIAIDKAGVLWTYLAYPDGRVTPRIRIGSGWDAYTQIAGQGDLTGDGRADIVARDKSGVLWLYKGTGDYKAPFEPRTRIGAGWNVYDKLLSLGDMDGDGKADLLARTAGGDLYFYRGTGDAGSPYAPPVKIGFGYDMFRMMGS